MAKGLPNTSCLYDLMKYPKKSKYNSRSCKCISGHIHHSRGEAGYCTDLFYKKTCDEPLIKDFEIQVKYPLVVNGNLIATHYPDFRVTLPGGSIEIHEYKGFATAIWRIKMKLFQALYPEIPYKVIYHK